MYHWNPTVFYFICALFALALFMPFLLFSKFVHLKSKEKAQLSVSFLFVIKKCDIAYWSLWDHVFVLIVARKTKNEEKWRLYWL